MGEVPVTVLAIGTNDLLTSFSESAAALVSATNRFVTRRPEGGSEAAARGFYQRAERRASWAATVLSDATRTSLVAEPRWWAYVGKRLDELRFGA